MVAAPQGPAGSEHPLPRSILRSLEAALVLLALVWASRAFDRAPLYFFGVKETVHTLSFLAALPLLWQQRRLRALLPRAWPVLLPVGLALLSGLWSAHPKQAWLQANLWWVSTALGLFLAARYTLREQLLRVATATTLVAAVSLAIVLAVPEFGVMKAPHAGAWSGSFVNRNHLAPVLVLGALACGLLAWQARGRRAVPLAALLLCLTVLGGTRSRAGPLVVLACALAAALLRGLQRWGPGRRRWTLAAVGAAALLIAAWIGSGGADGALSLVGRDLSLSGRTRIWKASLAYVGAHPVLGYGYHTFWNWGPELAEIVERIDYRPHHAHNAAVEMLLALGGLGLAAFALPFALFALRALRYGLAEASIPRLWPPLLLLALAMVSGVEPTLIEPTSLAWALYVATALTVSAGAAAQSSGAASS